MRWCYLYLRGHSFHYPVNDLKEGDYVWCKWGRCPYWPSLVCELGVCVCVCVCVEVASLTGNKSASSKEKERCHSQHSVLWLQY